MWRPAFLALLSHWRRHPGQLLTLVLGLALATALWSGVQAVNAEARASFDRAAAVLGQDRLARLVRRDGLPVQTGLFVTLRRAGYLVSPVIEGELRRGDGRLRILGLDPFTAPAEALPPSGSFDPGAGQDFLSREGVLLVSAETAADGLRGPLPPVEITEGLPPGTALTDIATAARLLGQDDPSYLLIAPEQPRGLPPLTAPEGLRIDAPRTADDLGRLSDSFRLNLTAFGFLAFAVGLFIVHSAIGLAFEQRRGTFRTLRALGLSLIRLILLLGLEMTLIALAAGAAGVALGYAVAAALLPGVAGTLRGLYGAPVSGELGFDPVWALTALAMTLLGAGIASARALWQVAHLPLLASAQPRAWAVASRRGMRRQAGAGAGLLVLAGLVAAVGGGLIAGFASLGALLLGAALLLPGALALVLRQAGRRVRRPYGQWLLADTRQQLPGLSLALMALLLALAANIGVSTMVGSFRTTFTGWLDQRLASELYVTARTSDEATAVREMLIAEGATVLPIVSVAAPLLGLPGEIYAVRDHATYRENWPLLSAAPDAWDAVAAGRGALANEQLARRNGLRLGDEIALQPGWRLPIVGIYSDYGNPEGQVIVGIGAFRARFPDVPVLRWAVRVDPAGAPALAERIRARFGLPAHDVFDQSAIKRLSLAAFDQTFLVTGALSVLTLGVAGVALLTSLLTLAGMRLPQLAPVWALGQTRIRLSVTEFLRACGLALLTFVLSVPTGLALAWLLLTVVNVEAFGWRLPMWLFPADWLRLLGLALLAAGLAALWPAIRLARIPPATLLKVFAHER